MAWRYYALTGEAGPDRQKVRIDFDAARVRRAAAEGRRIFAFANAATFLPAEGLSFSRVGIERPSLDLWLASLPRGTLIAAALAFAPFPGNLAALGHADARPPGREHSFEAFAVVIGRPVNAWRVGDVNATLEVDAASVDGRVPPFAGQLVAVTDGRGARVTLGGRTLARVDTGVALVAVAPGGSLAGAVELAPGETTGPEPAGSVYELTGESECATLTTGTWTDLRGILSTGSWVTTMYAAGSATIETVIPGAHDLHARSAMLLGDGSMTTNVTVATGGNMLITELTRTGERRAVFRLALDRPLAAARARLGGGSAVPSLRVCSLTPVRPLFEPGATQAVLRADFESEPFFGAAWGDVLRTTTGAVRRGEDGATLLLPLEQGRAYQVSLDLAADAPVHLDVSFNGAWIGACAPRPPDLCELSVSAVATHDGINTLKLTASSSDRTRPRVFHFRGAWIRSNAQLGPLTSR